MVFSGTIHFKFILGRYASFFFSPGGLSHKLITLAERKLLASFKGSLANALISCYPEHNWEPWKFKKAPSNFWKSPLNRRAYLTWLANTLRISSLSDWYSLTGSDLVNNHGGTLWRMHKGSVVDCLRSVFPEHNFQPWKFNKSQSRLWGDVSVCRSFLDHVSRELAIAKPSGWKDVTQKKIAELGGDRKSVV